MFSTKLTRYALMAILLGTAAATSGAEPDEARNREAAAQAQAQRDKLPDTPGTGRYPAMKEEVASLPNHVVYRPANLAGLGQAKLGVYLFGNGGCAIDGASARFHLLEIASHGYLSIAPGRIYSGPGAVARPAAPAGAARDIASQPRTSYRDLSSALEWVLKQNADPQSPYYGRVDTRAIAVSGFSCGGVQALRIAGDPRVKTVVVMNSGLFGEPSTMPEMDVPKSALKALHTPTFYLLGGETDIAFKNGRDDFQKIDHVPVFYADLLGVGHGGTYNEPNGGKAAAAVVAWLDWQLRGDAKAARTFVGKDCGLCSDKAWFVQKKRID
jgi:dienelactone hydrolase